MRTHRAILGVGALLAVGLVGPTAAEASTFSAIPHTPLAWSPFNVGDLVTKAIRKMVDLVVPDLGSRWAVSLVKWLVAVPNLTSTTAYPHLNQFRVGLVGLGFALLAVSLTLAGLQTIAGSRHGGQSLKRAGVAAFVLANYQTFVSYAVLGVNILTGSLVTSKLVTNGIDDMLGSALVVAAITGGLSLGLATGAAVACLYFIAALMVVKIGLTAMFAVLMLAGALIWGLYPLQNTSWLARAWIAMATTLALIPIAWALIFSAGALLASDSLIWSTGGSEKALSSQLQQVVKPFAAVACFWVAYKAPVFLMTAMRAAGLNPSTLLSGGMARGGNASGHGPSNNPLRSVVTTNADRFHGLGAAIAGRTAPATAALRARAASVRQAAAASVAVAAGPPSSARGMTFDAATSAAGRSAAALKLPVRANNAYRALADKGKQIRRRRTAGADGPIAGGPQQRDPATKSTDTGSTARAPMSSRKAPRRPSQGSGSAPTEPAPSGLVPERDGQLPKRPPALSTSASSRWPRRVPDGVRVHTPDGPTGPGSTKVNPVPHTEGSRPPAPTSSAASSPLAAPVPGAGATPPPAPSSAPPSTNTTAAHGPALSNATASATHRPPSAQGATASDASTSAPRRPPAADAKPAAAEPSHAAAPHAPPPARRPT